MAAVEGSLGAASMPVVNPYAVRPMSADISIQEMYKYSKLPNTDYGIEGYEVPTLHFDHQKKIEADINWKYNTFGKKRKTRPVERTAKTGGLNKEIEMRAKNTPGPWAYDIKQEWIHGDRKKVAEEVPTKPQQALEFKWKGVPKDEQEFKPRPRTARTKLDLSVTKSNGRLKNTPISTISSSLTPKRIIPYQVRQTTTMMPKQ